RLVDELAHALQLLSFLVQTFFRVEMRFCHDCSRKPMWTAPGGSCLPAFTVSEACGTSRCQALTPSQHELRVAAKTSVDLDRSFGSQGEQLSQEPVHHRQIGSYPQAGIQQIV